MSPWHLRQAAHTICAGGVIAYPTETVYGLGCDPMNQMAVERLLALKNRPADKGLIIIASDIDQLTPYIRIDSQALKSKITQIYSRPTTWVCPPNPNIPPWLTGQHNAIAIRITQHPASRRICELSQRAIVSTSANPSGLTPAHNALKARQYFSHKIDYLLHDHLNIKARPSRIINLIDARIIRP